MAISTASLKMIELDYYMETAERQDPLARLNQHLVGYLRSVLLLHKLRRASFSFIFLIRAFFNRMLGLMKDEDHERDATGIRAAREAASF